MKKVSFLFFIIIGLVFLQGCTRKISNNIPSDGKMVRSEVTFPDIDDTWLDGAISPNLENLRKIEAGMSKDQIRRLIAPPHYSAGLIGVIEWDYLFNLKRFAGEVDQICQYKIIFDKDYKAQSFFWNPQSCENLIKENYRDNKTNNFSFSNDFLFDFASSNLKSEGKAEIANLLSKFDKKEIKHINIIGYTDPIGGDSSNLILSQKRANAVKNEFINQGISPKDITAEGMGELNQVKICDNLLPKKSLIKCLKPNRRVAIDIQSY